MFHTVHLCKVECTCIFLQSRERIIDSQRMRRIGMCINDCKENLELVSSHCLSSFTLEGKWKYGGYDCSPQCSRSWISTRPMKPELRMSINGISVPPTADEAINEGIPRSACFYLPPRTASGVAFHSPSHSRSES